MTAGGWLTGAREGDHLLIEAGGAWSLDELVGLDAARETLLIAAAAEGAAARIDLAPLEALDTAGAWLLHRLERDLASRGWRVER